MVMNSAVDAMIDPKGWRATIGLILPTRLTTHSEYESRYLLPLGVGLICQRVPEERSKPFFESLTRMHEFLPDAARVLSQCDANVISFGCTASSFVKGREFELHLLDEIEKASGLPAVTVAGAVADAIRFLGAKKLLLIAPYEVEINKLLEKYLRDDQKIGLHYVHEMVKLNRSRPSWEQYKVVIDACLNSPPGADAIFFSCGATRSVELIPLIEAETGVPFLSTNLCNVWKCLQLLNIHQPIHGKGKLLEIPR